jgi:serine/threonine protein kinase
MPEPSPSSPAADRNLLFGILALQMDFIPRDALIGAMHAWVLDKTKPLGQLLVEASALRPDNRDLLEALVQRHLEMHHGDPQQSLAALRPLDSARRELVQIADPDLQASLVQLPGTLPATEDSRPTGDLAVGTPSAAGQRFRVLRPHAQGGRGQVSVALDEELHREVALKEIQERFADDPATRARFLLEAEVTGGLEHPGIVPVYGLGANGDGRPYYAMRLIQGDSLQEAVQRFHQAEGPDRDPGERALELRQLLGRFVAVCQAVAYAHSRGVIHRDLKPANIMLGPYGETLVVDWGLAKVVGRSDAERAGGEATLRPSAGGGQPGTQAGAIVGTPAYMSPEQTAGQAERLGPASDVYSLGATLYHLLTGCPPFEDRDVLHILRRAQRGEFAPPRQVNGAVPAALGAVCLKAMALRPEERYAGALELAAELERWLADEPVTCYREPYQARVARWVRRHQGAAVGAGVLLLTVTVSLAGGLYFVNAEKDRTEAARQGEATQRQLAGEERNQALDKTAEAQAVLDFFQDQVLAAARPKNQEGGLGIDATIRDAAKAAEPRIAVALPGRPLVEASIRGTLGTTYWYLGEYQAAIAQQERALALRRDCLGPNHPDTLSSMSNLANAYKAAGQLGKALPLLKEALAKRQETLGPDHPDTLRSLNNLAMAYDFDKALSLLEEALAKSQERLGPDHPTTLATMENLAALFMRAGQMEKALPLLTQVLAIRQATLGPEHPDTLSSMNNLAVAYRGAGQLDRALPLWEQALAKSQERLGPDHPDTLLNMGNLANFYQDAGQPDKALPLHEQVLAKEKERLGPDHPDTVTRMNSLASAYQEAGQLDKALPLFEHALAKRQERLGPDHPDTLHSMENLSRAYWAAGQVEQALRLLEQALAKCKAKLGPDHPDTLAKMNNLVQLYKAAGQLEKALPLLEQALPLMEQALAKSRERLGPDHPDTLESMDRLAYAYRDAGQLEKALPLWEQALTQFKEQLGPDHPTTLASMENLTSAYVYAGQFRKALPLMV